jgi:hypothetical protein
MIAVDQAKTRICFNEGTMSPTRNGERFSACSAFAAQVSSAGNLRVVYNLAEEGAVELHESLLAVSRHVTIRLPPLPFCNVHARICEHAALRTLREIAASIVKSLPEKASIELFLNTPP